MAEGIAKELFHGDPSVGIASAGLYAVPGNPPYRHAIRVCSNHGIYIASHRAQPLTHKLVRWADIIYCMEREQCIEITRRMSAGSSTIRLIGEGVPDIPDEIVDPFGGDIQEFEQTFSYLTRAIAFHFDYYKEGRRYDRKTKAFG